jgi:hypothetical protein
MIDLRFANAAATMWFWALVLRPLKRFVPLDTLVRMMRLPARLPRSRLLEAQVERYMERTARFPFRAPANCLERTLAAYRLLSHRSAEPELIVGFRQMDSGVEGHVWVTVEGRPIAESSTNLAGYATVTVFDAHGQRRETTHGASGETLQAVRFN